MKNSNMSLTFSTTILIIFTLGCSFFSQLFPGKGVPISAGPVELPKPPTPTAAIKGTPEEQAIYFVDQLAVPETRLAGWLGLYDALEIPIINQDGTALGRITDDPLGPEYWEVWYASEMDNNARGISLADGARILATLSPGFDPAIAPELLLRSLRESLKSKEARTALLGEFVRERIRRGQSKADISDPSATPDKMIIDIGTLELVTWMIIRDVIYKSAPRATAQTTSNQPPPVIMLLQNAKQLGKKSEPRPPCSARFGGSYEDAEIEKILIKNQDATEIKVSYAVGEYSQKLRESLGLKFEGDKEIKEALSRVGRLGLMLKLAFALLGINLASVQEPDPLERTRDAQPGKDGKIVWAARTEKLPEGAGSSAEPRYACFGLYFLTNGIKFEFPRVGRMADLRLRFEGRKGFPELVTFTQRWGTQGPDTAEESTNSSGEVTTLVSGSPQTRKIPDSAQAVNKEFSIRVSAVAERAGGDVKIGGFTFKSGNGDFNGIWNDLAPVRFELGEYVFRLTDWKQQGYWASGNFGPNNFSGVICDLEKPFSVNVSNPFMPKFSFTPLSADGGTWAYPYVGVSGSGGGSYVVEGYPNPTALIVTGSGTVVAPVSGTGAGTVKVVLTPLDLAEPCDE